MSTKTNLIAAAIVTVGAALSSVMLAAPAMAAKSCVMAGGEATMITADLAKFMATAALNNSMKAKDLKPTGAVKMKCNDPNPLTYCIATQRACK